MLAPCGAGADSTATHSCLHAQAKAKKDDGKMSSILSRIAPKRKAG